MSKSHLLTVLDLLLLKSNTHLYSHTAWARRSVRIWVAGLRGQQPIISSKRKEDEHSCQRPKKPRKKQRHTKLHGPRRIHTQSDCSSTTESAGDRETPLLLEDPPSKMKWYFMLGDFSRVPLPVSWEDKVVRMTPLDSHPTPWPIFGVRLTTDAPLHCGAERVEQLKSMKGGDHHRNNQRQLDTQPLHGNVTAGCD